MAELTLVSYFTASHKELLDLMLKSVENVESKILFQEKQICESARFRENGWNASTANKIKRLASIPANNELYFFSDADVVMNIGFKDWCLELGEKTPKDFVLYGYDTFQWCTGTMLFRQTEAVKNWWNAVYYICCALGQNDQDGLDALRKAVKPTFYMDIMPIENACNLASIAYPERPMLWEGQNFVVPQTCKVWHSNWSVGVKNKLEMCKIALKQMENL